MKKRYTNCHRKTLQLRDQLNNLPLLNIISDSIHNNRINKMLLISMNMESKPMVKTFQIRDALKKEIIFYQNNMTRLKNRTMINTFSVRRSIQ